LGIALFWLEQLDVVALACLSLLLLLLLLCSHRAAAQAPRPRRAAVQWVHWF
jgi:hypothetical protein